jgi:hypothetical protein
MGYIRANRLVRQTVLIKITVTALEVVLEIGVTVSSDFLLSE